MPPSSTGPMGTTLVRRSIRPPDQRLPTLGEGYRWYAYIEDRPVGWLNVTRTRSRQGVRVAWVPFTMAGARLAGPRSLHDGLDVLLLFDLTGRSPLRVCPACGRARYLDDRRRPLDHGPDPDHGGHCAMITGLFG
jgi:hypothetical protein